MIKENMRTSHIPIILLTARGSEEQRIKGLESMADYYIIKPFKLSFLETVIANLLKNRATLREHYSSESNLNIKPKGSKNLDRQFLNDLNTYINKNLDNELLNIEMICKHI